LRDVSRDVSRVQDAINGAQFWGAGRYIGAQYCGRGAGAERARSGAGALGGGVNGARANRQKFGAGLRKRTPHPLF